MKSIQNVLFKMYSVLSLRMPFRVKEKMLLFLFLMPFLFLISCAEEDDDLRTFLEKNDGTEWVLQNDSLKVFIRLNNDKEHLIEQWSFDKNSECYVYNPNIFSPGDFEIRENSIDQLVVLGDVILSDFECLTLSRQDSILTAHFLICEWQEESAYFKISTIALETLKQCN